MDTRPDMLARVRAALERRDARAARLDPPHLDESLVRRTTTDENLAAVFAERARAVGMVVHDVAREKLAEHVAALLRELSVRRLAVSAEPDELTNELAMCAQHAGAEVIDWRSAPGLEVHFEVDAALTDVQFAVAESGTLAVSSGPRHSRGAFLVPPVHLALVRRDQVVADLVDAWPHLRRADGQSMPAATVLITGPSKTADIEGILVTGVHGPREVHVLLV